MGLVVGIVAVLTGAALSSAAAAQMSPKGELQSLTLGLVSEIDQSAIESHFRDFVGYVAERLYPGVATPSKVVVAPTPFDLAKLLEQRRVDFYLESVYPTYTINYVHNAGKTILRRFKGGLTEYQSLIFAKRGGPIKRLEDLRGKTLAFEDPGSTSGYLLPKLFLQKQGFKLTEKRGYDPYAAPTALVYVFAYSQEKLVDLVLTQQVAAGAFSNDDHANLSDALKSDMVILAQTEKLPRHLVSVRADFPALLVAQLENILLAMHEDDGGRRILEKLDRTSQFERLPGGESALKRRLLDSFYSPERR